MKLPTWLTGTKSINFDEDSGRRTLAFARGNPTTEQSLEGSLELRRNVHAVIAALPSATKEHLTKQHYLDIAAVLILQRAEGYAEARLDYESLADESTPPSVDDVYLVPDSGPAETPEA